MPLCLVAISSCVPIFLITHLLTFFLPVTICISCFWLFLSFYSFTLFCSSMGSSFLLICLWVFLTFFPSLVLLSLCYSSCCCWVHLSYHSISFAVYALHLSSLILFWIVASILHIFSYFQSCRVLCIRGKGSPHNCTFFLPKEFPVTYVELFGVPKLEAPFT